jgi:hypothetical protein
MIVATAEAVARYWLVAGVDAFYESSSGQWQDVVPRGSCQPG